MKHPIQLLPSCNTPEWGEQATLKDLVKGMADLDPVGSGPGGAPVSEDEKELQHAWCPSGHYEAGSARHGSLPVVWSRLFAVDIDSDKKGKTFKKACKLPYVIAAWRGSTKGYHLVLLLDKAPGSEARYKGLLGRVHADIKDAVGHAPDPKGMPSPNSILFIPHGRKPYYNKDAVPYLTKFRGPAPKERLADSKTPKKRPATGQGATLEMWRKLIGDDTLELDKNFPCPLKLGSPHKKKAREARLWKVPVKDEVVLICCGKHKTVGFGEAHEDIKGEKPKYHIAENEKHQNNQALDCGNEYGDVIRYIPQTGTWLYWRAGWYDDEMDKLRELISGYIRTALSDTVEAARLRFSMNTSSNTSGVLTQIPAMCPELKVSVHDIDSDGDVLGTPSGYVNLRTGEVHDPSKELYITRHTTVDPDRLCGTPTWDRFMSEVLPDEEIRDWVLRWFGYCLTGSIVEHKFVIFKGDGRNGKSVLSNCIYNIMGKYAQGLSTNVLIVKDGFNKSAEMAGLRGARFVISEEQTSTKTWDEGLLKHVTGETPVRARLLYQNEIEFMPEFKLVINTNEMPRVNNTGEAMRDRMVVVPFDQYFGEDRRDPGLSKKLMQEAPGILWKLIKEASAWYQEGLLPIPPQIRTNTKSYFDDNDVVLQWFHDHVVEEEGAEFTSKQAHNSYMEWSQGRRFANQLVPQVFGKRLKKLMDGFHPNSYKSNTKGTKYRGVSLKPVAPLAKVGGRR